jgi:hypothetical protein
VSGLGHLVVGGSGVVQGTTPTAAVGGSGTPGVHWHRRAWCTGVACWVFSVDCHMRCHGSACLWQILLQVATFSTVGHHT